MTPAPILLTEAEFMALARLSRSSVQRGRKAGRIPFAAFGRTIRYPLASLPETARSEYLRVYANDSTSGGTSERKAG